MRSHGTLGSKSIENIELGDWVWSRNDETGEEGFKPVVHLFRNKTEELAHLTYTSCTGLPAREFTLTGTPGHKFWSQTRQAWTPMAELQPGETLLLAGGTTATVSSCRVEHLTQPVAIYNFEVADWHTYHVGGQNTGWVWVHNKRCAWKEYEERIQSGYPAITNDARKFKSLESGVRRTRVADSIAEIGGLRIGIEAKYIGKWSNSIYNPRSSIGRASFAVRAQNKVVAQAQNYSRNFDQVIYHSNNAQFIAHYSRVFQRAGLRNVVFRLTP